VISANFPDDAECTQASLPATRNPVSSKCATSDVIRALRMTPRQPPSLPATRRTIPATAPGETAAPNISATASHVRPRDRNWPCHRYAHTAVTRGPYCTGALTPVGAVPEVTAPHEQRRETIRCSVICARMSRGRSITCRRTVVVTGPPNSPFPQPAHRPGSWLTTSSGRPVISSVAPGCPFGRPGLRPDLPRSARGAGVASPSPDGGIDEFRGFLPSRARSSDTWAASASTCSRSIPISVSLASITSRSRAFAARSAATSSAAGGTSGTNHT